MKQDTNTSIGQGLLVLVGVNESDELIDCERIAQKIVKLKLWPNEEGQAWKKSVEDIKGQVICVSQFTLYANVKKGNKPDFHSAAKGQHAQTLYNTVLEHVRKSLGSENVGDGVFGAMMDVALVNDGPVTIEWDTRHDWKKKGSSD